MAHSLSKQYKIFNSVEEVVDPFEVAMVLSNGDVICKAITSEDQENAITLDEVITYINNNHIIEEEGI